MASSSVQDRPRHWPGREVGHSDRADVSTAGAALLIAVPFTGLVAERLLLGGGIGWRIFGPVLLTLVAAVPAAGAIGMAYLAPGQ